MKKMPIHLGVQQFGEEFTVSSGLELKSEIAKHNSRINAFLHNKYPP